MRRPRALVAADFEAIRRGLVAAGLSADDLGFDDISWLWQQGKTVEQIVATAVAYERGTARKETA